jgi:hypothetical protein
MTRDGGRRYEHDVETVEEIDAEVDALTDGHVAERLRQVLRRAVAAGASENSVPAGVDPAEADDLKATLRAMKLDLKAVEAALGNAKSRRDDALRHLAYAETRVANAPWHAAETVGAEDPYIATVLAMCQEILGDAHATADRILAEAKAEAEGIARTAENRTTRRPSANPSWT